MFNFIISLSERYWSLCVPRMSWSRILCLAKALAWCGGHPRWAYHASGTLRQSGRRIRKPKRERAALAPCASETANPWLSQVDHREACQGRHPATSWGAPNRKQQEMGEIHPAQNRPNPGDSSIEPIARMNILLGREGGCRGERQEWKRRSGRQHVRLWNRENNTQLPTSTRLAAKNRA